MASIISKILFFFTPSKSTKLNKRNGSLKIIDSTIGPESKFEDLVSVFGENLKELYSFVENCKVYKIDLPDDEYVYGVHFVNDKLSVITLYLKEGNQRGWSDWNAESEKKANAKVLENLGGEAEYLWGKVALYYDAKAGYTDVRIIYK